MATRGRQQTRGGGRQVSPLVSLVVVLAIALVVVAFFLVRGARKPRAGVVPAGKTPQQLYLERQQIIQGGDPRSAGRQTGRARSGAAGPTTRRR